MKLKNIYTTRFKRFVGQVANQLDLLLLPDKYAKSYIHKVRSKFPNPIFVNVGAGGFKNPLWINLDMPNEFYSSIQSDNFIAHDLSRKNDLPFASNTVDAIYSSHVIEHLDDECVHKLFHEAHRTLKEGGVLRLVVPDIEYLYSNFKSGDRSAILDIRPWGVEYSEPHLAFIEHFATLLVHDADYRKLPELDENYFFNLLNNVEMDVLLDFYKGKLPINPNASMPHGHCNWFSYDRLNSLLKFAGFNSIKRSEFGKSSTVAMRSIKQFDCTTPEISLFVEAIK